MIALTSDTGEDQHLKVSRGLDRQQALRSSKKFKRQPINDDEFNFTMMQPDHQILQATTTVNTPDIPTIQLLACYEDASFIYCQSSSSKCSSRFTCSSFQTTSASDSISSSSSPGLSNCSLDSSQETSKDCSDFYSASPSCISAFDYCHLSSAKQPHGSGQLSLVHFQDEQRASGQHKQQVQSTCMSTIDPVYLDDEEVFFNLMLKEASELEHRQLLRQTKRKLDTCPESELTENQPSLVGQTRHQLLSWMLKVCEHQMCQDDIFPLATMILDKYLMAQEPQESKLVHDAEHERLLLECNENSLDRRQLLLFAACSLLVASKLRQTPRLLVQALIEFSKDELEVELERDEILGGELLMLVTLKWDLAALVTPNDFLALLMRKCGSLLKILSRESQLSTSESSLGSSERTSNIITSSTEQATRNEQTISKASTSNHNNTSTNNKCDESRIRRHTQTLLELCLMDSQLSQHPPSVLAMTSMAVAINGLTTTGETSWRLDDIVLHIHQATHKENELKLMIEVAFQIEKYVQKLLISAHDD